MAARKRAVVRRGVGPLARGRLPGQARDRTQTSARGVVASMRAGLGLRANNSPFRRVWGATMKRGTGNINARAGSQSRSH